MTPLCYLNPAKGNNRDMLAAFAQGSGAELTKKLELVPGRPAVLYGVDQVTLPLWDAINKTWGDADDCDDSSLAHPYFYIDNGYFKSKWHGGNYYRITRNAPQCSGLGTTNGKRWDALGLKIEPWRKTGSHILIACQTDFWHQRHGHGNAANFADYTIELLLRYTARQIIVRGKPIKGHVEPPLEYQLENCWAVVTHCSMVGLEAILRGIPAFVLGDSAMSPVANMNLPSIENPLYPDGRERWAGVLADNQWTIDEIRNGTAWYQLHGNKR